MKKWRPFWSYQIEETEQWLSEMAGKGQFVKKLNFLSHFEFVEGAPKKQTYAIDLHSNEAGLMRAGWERSTSLGNWTIYEAQQAQIFPSRENVFKRLRTHFYTFLIVSTLLAPMIIMPLIFLLVLTSTNFLFDITLAIFMTFGALFVGDMFLLMKFRKKEKQYLGIQKMTESEKAIRKMSFGWMYNPYKTKKWLYEIFERGYELERAGNIFFYFIPRKSEKISYEIGYEKSINQSYFQLHKEMGWQLKFTTSSTFWNTTIWAMPYQEDEEKPMLTYVKEEKLQVLRRLFVFTTAMSLVFLFIMGMNIYFNVKVNGFELVEQFTGSTFSLILNGVAFILWLTIWIKAFFSYFNERKLLDLEESL
ncbi:DUF2812 domain-containing protein [Solibacillus sp. FSL K6-1523]|uniref:DUF2812 domain-containing protein n=1 Tax=Solibacillus sp. FSL K6-1523 TaxID=2921471 RepID=UPI0030F8157A